VGTIRPQKLVTSIPAVICVETDIDAWSEIVQDEEWSRYWAFCGGK
jgi:hypothetical protein